jgi:hypothetical protein
LQQLPVGEHRQCWRVLLIATCTVQAYLYVLDAVSNGSWGRNITGHLVTALCADNLVRGSNRFQSAAPESWRSLGGTFALVAAIVWWSSRGLATMSGDGQRVRVRSRPSSHSAPRRFLASRSDGVSRTATTACGKTS